jgi:putative ABC transport system permease protein
VRFQAERAPIIGTSLEYFRHRGLDIADGQMLTRLGDCVIGARVAREKSLKAGDRITSDAENVFDLAGVYPLRMRITGVLAPNHTPDDEAVFVDLKTAWVIEGLAHGHQDLAKPEAADLVRGREGDVIQATAKVFEFSEVTESNIDSFHFHGDPATYPISAAILIPDSKKNRALALGEYQGRGAAEQIVIPLDAITQLTETLFATRKVILAALILLGAAALALAALVFLLSFRLREREMSTYAKIGASDFTILALKATEVAIVLAAGVGLALSAVFITKSLAADLLPQLLN